MAKRAIALIIILQALASSCSFAVRARASIPVLRASAMSARRSGRLATLQTANLIATVAIDQPAPKRSAQKASEPAQSKKPRKTAAASVSTETVQTVVQKRSKKKAISTTVTAATATEPAAPKRAPPVRVPIVRATTARAAPLALHEPHLRLLSWNVNGIRALLRKHDARLVFQSIIEREKPHCLLLQETKVCRNY
jgi:hypothetical protein